MTIFPPGREVGARFIKRSKNYPKGKVKAPSGAKDHAALARMIFKSFIAIIFKRIAAGDTFMFPGSTGSYIGLEPIPDNEIKKLRQSGKYTEIDIIKANFKVPRFILNFGPRNKIWNAQVHVPKAIRDIAFRNAENGGFSYIEFRKL